jgi:molybdopterin-guanine dinucleotide biosynthesis protein A
MRRQEPRLADDPADIHTDPTTSYFTVPPAPTGLAEPDPDALFAVEPVTGIVLAGGRSKRMGRDKKWLTIAGRPMIQWVLDAVAEVTQYQMIVSRRVGRVADLGVPVVVDRFPGRGPLTGVHAGLKSAPTDLCLVVACDLPLVRPELLKLIAAQAGPMHAAVPYVAERPPAPPSHYSTAREAGLQPLCAAYRRACIGPLEKLLATGAVPAVLLVSVIKARIIPPEEWRVMDPEGRSFFNVNRPEDLATAAGLLAGRGT